MQAFISALRLIFAQAVVDSLERKWQRLARKKDKLREKIITTKAELEAKRAALPAVLSGQKIDVPSVANKVSQN